MAFHGTIKLEIIQGANLIDAETTSPPKAYIRFTWGDQEYRTMTCQKGFRAVWNNRFILPYSSVVHPSTLQLIAMNNRWMRRDTYLGFVDLNILDFANNQRSFSGKLQLCREAGKAAPGIIEIKLNLEPSPRLPTTPTVMTSSTPTTTTSTPDTTTCSNSGQPFCGSSSNTLLTVESTSPREASTPSTVTPNAQDVNESDKPSGFRKPRKRALLIGINYLGTTAELGGCVADAQNLKSLLVDYYAWPEDCIISLLDSSNHPADKKPTKANMMRYIKWLTEDVRPGDICFFGYSGHGSQQVDHTGLETDGMDETICPVDYKTAGFITDTVLHDILVKRIPNGARLTAIMDCCHSGTGLDLPLFWDFRKKLWMVEENPYFCPGDVQLLSGCTDCETSADIPYTNTEGRHVRGGAFITVFISAIKQNPAHTYDSLLNSIYRKLSALACRQRPQFSTNQPMSLKNSFNLEDIVPNQLSQLGQYRAESAYMDEADDLEAIGRKLRNIFSKFTPNVKSLFR